MDKLKLNISETIKKSIGKMFLLSLIIIFSGLTVFISQRLISNEIIIAELHSENENSHKAIIEIQSTINKLNEVIIQDSIQKQHSSLKNNSIYNTNKKLTANIVEVKNNNRIILDNNKKLKKDVNRLNNKIILLKSNKELLKVELDKERIKNSKVKSNNDSLSEKLELFSLSQSISMERLDRSLQSSIKELEITLEIAGLDTRRLLGRFFEEKYLTDRGIGGPLKELKDRVDEKKEKQNILLEKYIYDLEGLQSVMNHVPLAAPLDEISISSGFGIRKDPFTGKLAMHPGLDFSNRSKSPIYVTAPGKVSFVGWNGGYGKMVEVDHGLGIRTRYAHLSNIFVQRGQILNFREKVGFVGNTGRSTASHLHYEIIVDGNQLDPNRFLRAGKYIFKNITGNS